MKYMEKNLNNRGLDYETPGLLIVPYMAKTILCGSIDGVNAGEFEENEW